MIVIVAQLLHCVWGCCRREADAPREGIRGMDGKRSDLRAVADLSDQWGRGYVPQAPNRHIGDTESLMAAVHRPHRMRSPPVRRLSDVAMGDTPSW